MINIQPILDHIGPFLMVLFRLSGLFVFAPMLSSSIIPARARVLFAVVLTLALYPMLPSAQQAPIELDLLRLAPAIAGEVLVGVVIGLLATLPIFAAQLGGLIVGQQAGFTLGQIFNPALEIEADAFGQLFQFLAIFIFVAMGGLEILFLSVATTFARVPIGEAGGHLAPLDLMLGLVSSGFELAMRVSAPVLCLILIETIVTGVLSKSMPQVNIQSIGFATKIIAAFLALIASITAIEHAINDDVVATTDRIVEWARELPVSFSHHPQPAPER